MNRRGIWQLILMAQEGDRKAVDELFYMTYRSAYLIAYSLTNSKDVSLNIILDSYVDLLSNLSELDEAMDFFAALGLRIVNKVKKLSGTGKIVKIDKSDAEQANRWDPAAFTIHDFDTLPDVESDAPANKVIDELFLLDAGRRLCFLLFFYADVSTAEIAHALNLGEKDVSGALCSAVNKVLPAISEIQKSYVQLHHVTAESLLPWALRHNTAYSLHDEELSSFYSKLLLKLVDAGVLDTAMTDEETDDLIDIDLKDMDPLPEPGFFKSKAFVGLLIFAAFLLVAGGIFLGIKRVHEYNEMRAEIEKQTSRTTMQYSMSVVPTDNLIFSTEYDQTSEDVKTTDEEKTSETSTTETTTQPKEDYGGLSFIESGNNITITGYDNSKPVVSIPDKINGKTVTAISENAFFNSNVERITMPNTIKTIGAGAFYSCSSLRSIVISSGVTKLMENTFRGCSSLTDVTLPNSLDFISSQVFYKCSSLSRIVIPPSVTYLGDWAFANCSALTAITIPDGVTYVGKSLFYECEALERCTFSSASELTALNEWMFFSCKRLKSFAIPVKVTYIPANCFYGCSALERMTLSEKISAVDANAFTDCKNLTTVLIPGNVKKIDSSAFSGCEKLTSINLQNGTTYIGSNAFAGCSGLTTAIIPSSVTEIGQEAFKGCSSLTIHCPSGSYAESYAENNSIKYINT